MDKPNSALPKCLLITLMECKSIKRHQKGFKSGESGKSSNVTSYIKSHTPNNRGAEVGRNLWRLSHPYLKMKHSDQHIHIHSKWDTDITSLSFDQTLRRAKSIVRERGGWNHRMRSANMSESAAIPEAKSTPVSELPGLVVRIYRNHSRRAGTRIPHRLSAEHEKPNRELLKHWQCEQGVKVGGH